SGALLPHLFTLTLSPCEPGRYVFCGTGRLAAFTPRSRTLSGTLPCGVRTFLSRTGLRQPGSGRPARLLFLLYASGSQSAFPVTCEVLLNSLPFWISNMRESLDLVFGPLI